MWQVSIKKATLFFINGCEGVGSKFAIILGLTFLRKETLSNIFIEVLAH
jgi:hypothetical protein